DSPEFSMEFYRKRVENFPFLFGSDGLFKDIEKDFTTNQDLFYSLNQEVDLLRKELSKLSNEVKIWVDRNEAGGQYRSAEANINQDYPPSSPKDERYNIARAYISNWKTCVDKFKNCKRMCDKLVDPLEKDIQKTHNNMNQVLDQLEKLSAADKDFCLAEKIRIKDHFSKIKDDLEKYKSSISATKKEVEKYRDMLNEIIRQQNMTRLARTPAYNNQPQNCSNCNYPFAFLKWCMHCDRNQFKKQYENKSWTSGNVLIDNLILDSQLSIKYPNGYIQWIPYEQFTNIEFKANGGFGTVYKANWVEGFGVWDYALGKRDRQNNTPVALKELKSSENMGEDFSKEIGAYIKSSSSTVLRCYGISKNPKTKNFVMVLTYAHGGDLRNYLMLRSKNLNWVDRLDILRHILFGLKDIHSKGLVHHDLHPGNLLHFRRTISISDLGLCGPVNTDAYGSQYGVLSFTAPEVLFKRPYTQAADIYSIGMIMWSLTSGKQPFYDIADHGALAFDICYNNFRPNVVKGTPPVYEEWMRKCWHADPDKRPTVNELYDVVLTWLNGFDKKDIPEQTKQFIENNSKVKYNLGPVTSSDLTKITETISENLTPMDKEEELDEWNTIQTNDYQNWLYKINIMGPGEDVASIVTKKNVFQIFQLDVSREDLQPNVKKFHVHIPE
ncbi:10342_t:CDS:2, partial [Dentiscutata heterogama]